MKLRELYQRDIFRKKPGGVRWIVLHVDVRAGSDPIYQILSENGAYRTTKRVDDKVYKLATLPNREDFWSWKLWHDKKLSPTLMQLSTKQ